LGGNRTLAAPKAKLIALDHFLDDFFRVVIGLEENGWVSMFNDLGFETSVMWHAVYCEMREGNTFNIESLNKGLIFKRFMEDIAQNNENDER
jgi:hypothetical protein